MKSIEPTENKVEVGEGHGADTIAGFCRRHKISPAFYYLLRKRGEGPAEMVVGRRRLISYEAATAWRRERERATAQGCNSSAA
jgi:hypothetical protein